MIIKRFGSFNVVSKRLKNGQVFFHISRSDPKFQSQTVEEVHAEAKAASKFCNKLNLMAICERTNKKCRVKIKLIGVRDNSKK